MANIVQEGDPALRTLAAPVAEEAFGTPELTATLDTMISALEAEPDGVALAAPQVGIPLRIFVVRYDRLPPPGSPKSEGPADIGIYINPLFVNSSRRREEMEEGCLSVRGTYGRTYRNERATVRARTADGSHFERGGGGILAQAFQHEIDHLDGILFIDHALETYDAPNFSSSTLSDVVSEESNTSHA